MWPPCRDLRNLSGGWGEPRGRWWWSPKGETIGKRNIFLLRRLWRRLEEVVLVSSDISIIVDHPASASYSSGSR